MFCLSSIKITGPRATFYFRHAANTKEIREYAGFTPGEWFTLRMKQSLIPDTTPEQYRYEVFFDDRRVKNVINNSPATFPDVTVRLGAFENGRTEAPAGEYRNFWFRTNDELIFSV